MTLSLKARLTTALFMTAATVAIASSWTSGGIRAETYGYAFSVN